MPYQTNHTCARHTCRNSVPAGQSFCDEHRDVPKQRARDYRKFERDPEINKLYHCKRWTETTALIKQLNPICQRIIDGEKQCTRPAYGTHHLVDPKDDKDLFYEWTNLVAICAHCHAGGQRGETQGHRYTSTIGVLGSIYDHGQRVYPDWQIPFGNQPPLPTGNSHSTVGESAIDRALNDPDW